MKALTLHQPWATLVALGVKTIETRSWSTRYRGRLLIHAAAKRPDHWRRPDDDVAAHLDHVRLPWDPAEANDDWWRYRWCGPLGAIVASGALADVVRMVVPGDARPVAKTGGGIEVGGNALYWRHVDGEGTVCSSLNDQRPYGDFRPGRYAWLLEDVQPTTARCPACWGTGTTADCEPGHPSLERARLLMPCPVCHSTGAGVAPIPARGYQQLWTWRP